MHTLPEVTIEGSPSSVYDDKVSDDDAYADGYSYGYYGQDFGFGDKYTGAAHDAFEKGYNVGQAAAYLAGGGEHGGAGEVAEGSAEVLLPPLIDHYALHGLLHGAPFMELLHLAISPMGDTQLHRGDVYLPICAAQEHNLHGDPVLDAGAWHGQPTMSYSDADSELRVHGADWGHTQSVSLWTYDSNEEWHPGQ